MHAGIYCSGPVWSVLARVPFLMCPMLAVPGICPSGANSPPIDHALGGGVLFNALVHFRCVCMTLNFAYVEIFVCLFPGF